MSDANKRRDIRKEDSLEADGLRATWVQIPPPALSAPPPVAEFEISKKLNPTAFSKRSIVVLAWVRKRKSTKSTPDVSLGLHYSSSVPTTGGAEGTPAATWCVSGGVTSPEVCKSSPVPNRRQYGPTFLVFTLDDSVNPGEPERFESNLV